MPDQPVDLPELEQTRAALYGDLARVGDFRRGNLNAVHRRCGRPNCACASPGHPGHGPQYNLTRSAAGKTVNVHLKPGPQLDKVRQEVDHYREFVTISQRIVDVNEAICEARPVSPLAAEAPAISSVGEKGGSSPPSKPSSPPR